MVTTTRLPCKQEQVLIKIAARRWMHAGGLRCIHLIALEQRVVIRYVQSARIAPLSAFHKQILLQLYQV